MKIALYFCLLMLPGLVLAQNPIDKHYKIYDVKQQKEIALNDIVTSMDSTTVLFFGEIHTDSVAHYLEFKLLSGLFDRYKSHVALSMEMFETDCQPVVNEFLKGLIRERNFMTDARAWKNYDDYRPMVNLIRYKKADLIAANAPARYTNMVSRMGLASLLKLDSAGRSHLPPLPIDTATGPYYQKFLTVMGGHTTFDGQQIYQAQNLWDATMAWSIAGYLKLHPGYKVLQINGGFHSEDKLGAMAQLQKYAPGTRTQNIAIVNSKSIDKPDWKSYAYAGDYIIMTDTNEE